MEEAVWKQGYTQNRELSWLQFNARVLAEAQDEQAPLLERLKFLSIFTSNLDEFYMIRVGSLGDIAAVNKTGVDSKSGLTAKEQLEQIYAATAPLYQKRDRVFTQVEKALAEEGLCHVSMENLTPEEQKYVKHYFRHQIQPILSPQIVDSHHPFPHLDSKVTYVGALLGKKKNELLGLIPVPRALPRVVYLQEGSGRYVLLEELLLQHAHSVFAMYDVLEKVLFCITRNADINLDDEPFNPVSDHLEVDVRAKMEKLLRLRSHLRVVRLELSNPISNHFAGYFRSRFSVEDSQIFLSRKAPLDLSYVFGLGEFFPPQQRQRLSDPPFSPQQPAMLRPGQSLLQAAMKQDILLSYPYESMEPFLQMIREAAHAPDVVSIRITIYRLARKAKLVEYLCAAAENGKDVTVLIELRARFDEQNNIDWSERLEEAGCKVIYGFEEYKVHSKICLITRQINGVMRHITQVGTGNYNEKTAKQYTDVSLVTSSESIGADAAEFFKNMALGNLEGHYDRLLVAPGSLKSGVLSLIDEQIRLGRQGYILLKFNSLTDIDIIRRLAQASQAGVKVDMIIRGICCLRPGVPGITDNITVVSIVGRYLEHSRIFCFGRGEEEKMYISSADFMTRNTVRRVEIACPIDSPEVRRRLHGILDAMLSDTAKARVLLSDGSYRPKIAGDIRYCAQEQLMENALEAANSLSPEPEESPKPSLWQRMLARFRRK